MSDEKPDFGTTFERWQKYEDTAMHFNDVILRLRTQALGGLTAVVTLSGFAANLSKSTTGTAQWGIIAVILVFLLLAWIAVAILDLCYYHSLLMGAVEALLDIEKDSTIKLSTMIDAHAGHVWRRTKKWAWFHNRQEQLCFYGVGVLALVLAIGYSWGQLNSQQAPTTPQPTSISVKIDGPVHLTTDHSVKGDVLLKAEHTLPSELEIKAEHFVPGELKVRAQHALPSGVNVKTVP